MKYKFRIGNGSIEIHARDIYLAHENVRKNNINIFTNWGEFVVNEKDRKSVV